ncbi:MAG: hypothetical protein QOI24_235 [Acidobacteriota bacterium]|jgi:hypothetical protein|nr:hypothetical protein [Acidobacteriota bacterium]
MATFVVVFFALLVPYEALVRASERRYGVHRARIADPKTISPRVDGFLADLAAGRRYDTIAVGTSRVEYAIRPDILAPHFGLTQNLGIGGVSSTPTLEWLEQLGLHPKLLIVSVTPMDLTPMAIVRGERAVQRASISREAATPNSIHGPGDAARIATYSLLHGATDERHRNLGEWLELVRDGGNVLAFLNNEDATGPVGSARTTDGYTPSAQIASVADMEEPQLGNVAAEMIAHEAETSARLIAVVKRFRARGTRVVIVRIPTAIGIRRTEDASSGFDARVRRISAASGVPYIDGLALVGGEAFARDGRNFSDAEHMNSRGAIAFSNALVRALE